MSAKINTTTSSLIIGSLALLIVSGAALIFWQGYAYYMSPVDARLFSPEHKLYGSTGLIGLGCGIAATVLFLSNLLYLLRKAIVRLHWFGTLRAWLNWHVMSGLLGGLLVTLHSAFEIKTIVTRTLIWAFVIVIATGLIGRYMIRFIPRTKEGELLKVEALETEVMALVDALRPSMIGNSQQISILQTMVDELELRTTSTVSLRMLFQRLRQMQKTLGSLNTMVSAQHPDRQHIEALVKRAQKLSRYLVMSRRVSQMMDSWRLFHRVMTLLFWAVLSLHIVGAFYYKFVSF